MNRAASISFLLFAAAASVTSQVRFSGLDINEYDEVLFHAAAEVPRYGDYQTLFLADIPAAELRQLTLFPERLTVLGDGSGLQIQNRFGVFRTALDAGGESESHDADADATAPGATPGSAARGLPFQAVPLFPSFVNGRDIQTGKTLAVGSSPDGRYLSYLLPTSAGYADLKLYDALRERETTVATGVATTLDAAPLRWAPDSSFFVYSKGNELFYYSIEQYQQGRVLAERLRRIGGGQITSIRWSGDNTLFYVTGTVVYRVRGPEFFARSLYQDLLGIGEIVGKLPSVFDPNFDRFWISPDGTKLMLSDDGRSVTVLFMQTDDFESTGDTLSLPFLFLPRNTRVRTVLWSQQDVITVLTGSIEGGATVTDLYRIDLRDPDSRSAFRATGDVGVRGIAISPDGARALVWTENQLQLRTYSTWETTALVEHEDILHAVWDGAGAIVIAGRYSIERATVDRRDGSVDGVTLVALSQVESYGFAPERGTIRARAGDRRYELRDGQWRPIDEYEVRAARVAGDAVRVYLENLSRGSYGNMVMVRNVETFGTLPLFPRPQQRYEPFPETDDPVDLTNFSHGSRIRRREVSLVFNAVDSVAGLTEILNTLAEYDVRATFFVNGDFIRRHPGAVRQIAESGHEVGNLFFTYFDMSTTDFQITADFIRQGLARNEDEYFEVTGDELTLLWHAPYYFVTPDMIAAGREMNYAYIGRDVDSLDWVPKWDENGRSRLYKPSARIVEDVIAQKQPGSIIAMTIGRPGDDRPEGGRDDYLFNRLDVLINGLIQRGYRMVPVSVLMDNAR